MGRLCSLVVVAAVLLALSVPCQAKRKSGADNLQGDWWRAMRRLNRKVIRPAAQTIESFLGKNWHGLGSTMRRASVWAGAENLAQAMEVPSIDSVVIPINVNLLFVGFDGDDGLGIRIKPEELTPWLSQVHHTTPHTTANPASDAPPPPSRVSYAFRFHVHEVSAEADDAIFKVISNNMRLQSPSASDSTPCQVDALAVGDALHSLVEHLNISHSYTLFVLNPDTTPFPCQTYGYRYGLSNEEVANEPTRQHAVAQLRAWSAAALGNTAEAQSDDAITDAISSRRVRYLDEDVPSSGGTVEWHSVQSESAEWARTKAETSFARTPEGVLQRMVESQASDLLQYVKTVASFPDTHLEEDCLTDMYIDSGRVSWVDLSAGPLVWGPVVGGESVKSELSLPRTKDVANLVEVFGEDADDDGEREAVEKDSVRKELELLQEVLESSCGEVGEENDVEACADLRDRVKALEDYSRGNGDQDTARRLSMFISDAGHVSSRTLALDTFLSNVGAFVDQTLHHLLVPAAAPLHQQFYERVAFNVYIVTNHELYEPDDPANFHFAAYRKELERMKLPKQDFSFSLHKILLKDDPMVAMAYYSSLRTAMIPTLKIDGTFETSQRLYLDAAALVQQLQRVKTEAVRTHYNHEDDDVSVSELRKHLFAKKDEKTARQDTATGTLQIPVFLFSLHESNMPVFVDKHFQARAVQGVVVAVQSSDTQWDSHMGCNGKHIAWNLRNPLRAMLMSSAQVLAGLLPAHVHYSATHGRIAQNWLWSVGRTPLSYTSHGAHFSSLHVDIGRRNQLVGVLDHALDQVTAGFAYLAAEVPTRENQGLQDVLPSASLRQSSARLDFLFREVALALDALDFAKATRLSGDITIEANQFYELVLTVVGMMEMGRCDAIKTQRPFDSTFLLFPACALVGVLGWFALRSTQKAKPKIN